MKIKKSFVKNVAFHQDMTDIYEKCDNVIL